MFECFDLRPLHCIFFLLFTTTKKTRVVLRFSTNIMLKIYTGADPARVEIKTHGRKLNKLISSSILKISMSISPNIRAHQHALERILDMDRLKTSIEKKKKST